MWQPKSMRSAEDIMADYIANKKLPANEERLLDRKVFEKTGKHIDKYKDKNKPKPKPANEIVLEQGSGSANKQEAKNKVIKASQKRS